MKALFKVDGLPGLQLLDTPVPAVRDDDVLIRVHSTGICGTDVHVYQWDAWAQRHVTAPLVVGHEFVGEVVETGRHVSGFRPGDLVGGEGHLVCGRCRDCREGHAHHCAHTRGLGIHHHGAFAEYLALPATNVWRHNEGTGPDAAVLFDPLGNAVHTAGVFPVLGEDVLVTGAGPIGIMTAMVAERLGANSVTLADVSEFRVGLARDMGVRRALDVRDLTPGSGRGFGVALETSGAAAAVRQAVELLAHGGKLAALGLPPQDFPVDWSTLVLKSIAVQGVYGRRMFATWRETSSLIDNGLDVAPVITHRFPFTQFTDAFATAAGRTCGKVVMQWHDDGRSRPHIP
ncbi:L-threonine 3-dehydrogenase [Streptomyces sp. WAC07149]|uniref:L-threonine 3-dehydrogenase n=1 Tax=Streptomyces sp. WAC07149 TaxID=2487425 RepID=UPI000F79F834|nr:L-threonine 3-dehydrogenase [Streptomyces sp. WAC07149]RST08698.1 L-threonine 3-dehydrogenase [Streptomyces sp. WAC07149]